MTFLGLGPPLGAGEVLVEACPSAEEDLFRRLEEVRLEFGSPAVAGGYVTPKGEVVVAVSGVRRAGTQDSVTLTDLFHLGSVTKPFTGTLAAVLVAEDVIGFDATIGKILGEFFANLHPGHRSTTLGQILRHRAGFQGFEEDEEFERVPRFAGSVAEKRRGFVDWLLAQPPKTLSGSEHSYSNAGYSVAAVLMEQMSGQTWEELMVSKLLGPLGIEHFGFGWPIETGKPGTWGHRVDPLRADSIEPHDPSIDGYRLEDQYIGPAGDLSMDIDGLARFARFHLLGLQGKDQLLTADEIDYLHTPLDEDTYAIGWNTYPNRSTHVGSAGTAFAAVYLMRNRQLAMVVATNVWSDAEEEFGAALLRAVLGAAKAAGAIPD